MNAWEISTSPIAAIVVTIAFIGSLFACRNWMDRVSFTVVMPIAYGMMWFLVTMVVGYIAAHVFGNYANMKVQEAAFLASAVICFVIFTVQVRAMSHDTSSGPHGYALKRRGRRGPAMKAPGLQRLPTRKRWSG